MAKEIEQITITMVVICLFIDLVVCSKFILLVFIPHRQIRVFGIRHMMYSSKTKNHLCEVVFCLIQ